MEIQDGLNVLKAFLEPIKPADTSKRVKHVKGNSRLPP